MFECKITDSRGITIIFHGVIKFNEQKKLNYCIEREGLFCSKMEL